MTLFFALIPVIDFILLSIVLYQQKPVYPVRQVFLRATLLQTVYLVLAMELLSPFKGITQLGLSFIWLLPLAGMVAWLFHRHRNDNLIIIPSISWPKGWPEWFLFILVGIVLSATFLIAWLVPPQTWDSLTYHSSRIAHWAQNRSIWHYITGIERQNSISPGAEIIALNAYVLTAGDRLANFPQWLSMLGSLIGISLITRQLGANAFGQWIAVAFAATIPIGIVESSSSINDYVACLWVVCMVLESVTFFTTDQRQSLFYIFLAAALGALTKLIVVPYLIPFALWIVTLLLKRTGFWGTLKWGAVALTVIAIINAGFITRNLVTYGSLSNPVDFQNHANRMPNWRGLISLLIKHAGLHAGLPNLPGYNDELNLLALKVHVKLGLDVMDPRTTGDGVFRISEPSTQEDRTTNPHHAYLILFSFAMVFPFWKKVRGPTLFYSCLVAVTFVLFSFIYKWHVFSGRYHLPFFVLFSPVIGILYSRPRQSWLGLIIAGILFWLSLPWLVSIESRPLIPYPNRTSAISILKNPRNNLYFGGSAAAFENFRRFIGIIRKEGCNQIGLMLWGDDPEYSFWVLFDTPSTKTRLEWIVAGTPSDRYEPKDFQACAIICTDCPLEKPIRGLPFLYQDPDNGFQIFMQP